MSHKHGKRKNSTVSRKKPVKQVTDVTLSEFADSQLPQGKGRTKKAARNIQFGVRKISISEDDKSWEEKVIEDDELLDQDEGDSLEVVKQEKAEASSSEKDQGDDGSIYPLDIWFLISDHIRPEQVCTFSQICRSSYSVVNTPKFWISLYKRCYRRVNMPARLQPHCLEVHHGLKANVIKALYYIYLPFSMSAQTTIYLNDFEVLEQLIGMQCLLMFIEKVCDEQCNRWIYKFKLKRNLNDRKSPNKKIKERVRTRDDINSNAEEGCKMLFIPCRDYIAIPCVSGYKLKKVSGFWKELKLVFTLGPLSKSSTEDVTVVLTPCYKPSLFDWWHPMYYSSGRILKS